MDIYWIITEKPPGYEICGLSDDRVKKNTHQNVMLNMQMKNTSMVNRGFK